MMIKVDCVYVSSHVTVSVIKIVHLSLIIILLLWICCYGCHLYYQCLLCACIGSHTIASLSRQSWPTLDVVPYQKNLSHAVSSGEIGLLCRNTLHAHFFMRHGHISSALTKDMIGPVNQPNTA